MIGAHDEAHNEENAYRDNEAHDGSKYSVMANRTPALTPETASHHTQATALMAQDFQTKLRTTNAARAMGRPRLDPETFMETLIERLSSGESLLTICNHSDDMPSYEWVMKLAARNPELFSQIDRSRMLGTEALFDSMQDIASGGIFSTGDVYRDKLLVEVLWRTIQKRNPNKFGDRIQADGGVMIIARPSDRDGLGGLFNGE